MFKALEIAASGMASEQVAMNTVANNMANTNTVGFKSSQVRFEELLSSQESDGTLSATGVGVAGTQRDLSQGALTATGQTWDLAISGSGYFPVIDANGREAYTRAGSFHVDSEGHIVNPNGLALAAGITVPTGAQNVQVGQDGTVQALLPGNSQSVVLGKIDLVGFADEQGLTDRGNGLFDQNDASGPPLRQGAASNALQLGSIQQGALEGSNVNMVQEMVDMINTQRAYETGAKVITAADEMLGYANSLRR